MDTKLIQQYGEDILSYRLRDARQKKRMQHKDFEKWLIQLHKEEKALYCQKRNIGWESLTPPVQRGWKRFFVLREDVARSSQAAFYENILAKIITKDWSYRKDFLVRKRRFGKKKYEVKEQKLLQLDEHDFLKLGFSEKEKQLFYEEYYFRKWSKRRIKKYVFSEPWRFVLRVRPNMIDKVRVRDEALEARLQQINNYLERNDFRWIQIRLLNGNCKWRHWNDFEKYDETNPFRNWPLERVLDSLKEEL
jgi:hypothetical protein